MPFLVTTSGADGLTYTQTRRTTLRTPTRGVRTDAKEVGWLDDVRAVALTLPQGAVYSHTTAAQILDLPLPQQDGRPLHVTVPRHGKRGSRKIIAWHRSDLDGEVATVQGLPVTVPQRTWRDLAGHLQMPGLVAVADHMLRRGMVEVDQLSVPPGCKAADRLRASLELVDARSRSVRESLLRVRVLQRGLPRPEINFDIVRDGGWIGCGDMVWPEFGLIVEYDGEHHADPRQRHQDAQTRNAYAEYGWECTVLTSKHFTRLDDAVEQIARALGRRGWSPTA